MTTHPSLIGILPESLLASGQTSEKLNLLTLQSKMKYDPEGYESELVLLYSQFKSSVELFKQQAALNFTSLSGIGIDLSVAKYLGNRAMLLAHVTPFYPKHLSDFPSQLANLLNSSARLLPSGLRCNITQALILLINRKIVHIGKTLALFLELQTLGDRVLRKLSFSHVIHSIRRMNKKHKNEAKNRTLQNIVFSMLQQDDEAKAKRSLVTLCELHRRKVWCNDRTSNEICRACLHSSPRIMTAALSFLYDYEKIKDNDDSDASSSEDEGTPWAAQVVLDKATIYKANHKGTIASKKKKRAKLQRAIRSMKRQQRLSSESNNSTYYSPLNHLKDPQDFAEKLFSRLQTCNERFEVKMMILKVIARTIELHRLILLDFYSFLQKYIQPHQRDITNLLAAAVQACHERVPHNEVEPLFKYIVNQFVHDRSRPEAITVGLSAIREICLRMPSLMKQGLLRDLVSYKKLKVKPVSAAARSLIMLFREIYPSLLIKKDRGRLIDPKAKPKAYGEVIVASNVPGVELLYPDGGDDEDVSEDVGYSEGDGDTSDVQSLRGSDDENTYASDNKGNHRCSDGTGSEDKELQDDGNESEDEDIDGSTTDDDDENDNNNDDELAEDEEAIVCYKSDENCDKYQEREESKPKKRKFTNFDGQLIAADASLRALKRLTGVKMGQSPYDKSDGILSNEDFERIKELMAKKEAKATLMRKGLLKTSDQLSLKAVNPSKFDANRWRKLTKEERLAVIRAGREDRGKYQARTAVKQKKKGGLSNRQKEHKKAMPLAAKRAKVARSRQEKKKKQQRSGKQFCGKKAWKQ